MSTLPTIEQLGLDQDSFSSQISYDNGVSGLAATLMKDAIDEIAAGVAGGVGEILLVGRVNSTGAINLNTGKAGVSYSVVKTLIGTYDITLTGVTGNVIVKAQNNTNDNAGGSNRPLLNGGVTQKLVDTDTFPTNAGFRYRVVRMFHQSCGGCPYMDNTTQDHAFSFIVYQG